MYHYTNALDDTNYSEEVTCKESKQQCIEKIENSIKLPKTEELMRQVKELEKTVNNISNLISQHMESDVEKKNAHLMHTSQSTCNAADIPIYCKQYITTHDTYRIYK